MAVTKIRLTSGPDVYALDPSARNTAVYGLDGDDVITGGAGANTFYGGAGNDMLKAASGAYNYLDGNAGNDTLILGAGGGYAHGGPGDDVFVFGAGGGFAFGGTGSDVAVLPGNPSDYTFQPDASFASADLENAQGKTFDIASDVETVRFRDGESFTYADLPQHVALGSSTFGTYGDDTLVAPVTGNALLQGGPGNDTAILNGNPSDYTLSRYYPYSNDSDYSTARPEDGAFTLSANNGSGVIGIAQDIENVQFKNGQVVPLVQLASIIGGNPVFTAGSDVNDLLYAGYSGDQYLIGAGGYDTAYIHGNTNDYTIKAVNQSASSGAPAIDGYELVANNGSGNLYVDQSTEVVHFQNGQDLSYGDLTASISKNRG